MSNATVDSILARCMMDPAFLDHLASDPDTALKGYALEPQIRSDFLNLDTGRLLSFAGLVAKVQNNGLWEHFVHTRTLLNYYQIDLKVFVAYRHTHLQNRQSQLSRNQQIEKFLSFLWEYLESDQSFEYPAVRELLAHEQFTWELRLLFSESEGLPSKARQIDFGSLRYRDFMNLVPIISGSLRVREFDYRPLAVISDLTEGQFDHQRLAPEPTWLVYWADYSTGQLRILELDQPIAAFLTQTNGRRSIRTLIQRVVKSTQSDLRPSEFRPFLQFAFQEGLLAAASDQHGTKE